MNVEPINLKQLQTIHHIAMRNGVVYDFGSKVSMSTPVEKIKRVDCSGWSRYLIYHSTNGKVDIGDGSWNQRGWCQKHGMVDQNYNVEIPADPESLYLCFMDPKPSEAGHVWFVNDLETFESYGGHGPGERRWNTRILRTEVDYCFKWPHVWK